MKILCVHAHFDDFEFVAGGTFEVWRRRLGPALQAKIIVCTDGSTGHQFRTREETAQMRLAEQRESARLGGYEFELLKLPSGEPSRSGCLLVTQELLAGLWKAIRDFEPDYLFCPPVAADPLAGIHVDHVSVAEAVRKVAYMINVPHAFTTEYPTDETQSQPCKVPVILNTYDGYMAGANAMDLAIDVDEAFPTVCAMSWCHQSQIVEWLPWVGRHGIAPPHSLDEWSVTLRRRYERQQRRLGLPTHRLLEFFTVTAWGSVPTCEQLKRDFPNIVPEHSAWDRLRERLERFA